MSEKRRDNKTEYYMMENFSRVMEDTDSHIEIYEERENVSIAGDLIRMILHLKVRKEICLLEKKSVR